MGFIPVMQELLDFYTQLLQEYVGKSDGLQKRLKLLSISRLVAFIAVVLAFYFFRNDVLWATTMTLGGMAIFLFLIRYYADVKNTYRLTHALAKLNETEIKVLQYDFQGLSCGSEYFNAQHSYSHDMDLFGEGSFFQYLNRTQLKEGKDLLARLLVSNDIQSIGAKQETVDELAQKPQWRQHFTAQAMLIGDDANSGAVTDWLQGYSFFVPPYFRFLPWVFLAVFGVLAILTFQLDWSLHLLLFWVVLGLGITAGYFKKISHLAQKADRVKATFKSYSTLVRIIEETNFKAPQLKYQKQRLYVTGTKTSLAVRKFGKLLDMMDYNNNIFYAILGNGCFLGALWTAYQIEKWIKVYRSQVGEWFYVIAFFEAYNSLGNFSFNHPLYSYPVINNGPLVLGCKDLGHPLIPANKNVKNSFEINDEDFFIVTGSNMAGKSTFLRTVGLSMVMANLGLPINAEECIYNPRKLVTSMRSIDSLYKGDSYFLSELKRLKKVVQLLQTEPYLVLLDEILKGTNSTDKAMGSKRFLAKLIKTNATGLIATHDLSLCNSANDFPNVFNISIKFFRESEKIQS